MKLLRSSLSSLIYYGSRWCGNGRGGCRILCYHGVNDTKKSYLSVTVSNFEAQMKFLHDQGYETVGLGNVAVRERVGVVFPPQVSFRPTEGRAGTQRSLDSRLRRNDTIRGGNDKQAGVALKPIVITFDDGFRDNYEHAFPIMKNYGFTGTIFLIGEKVGTEGYLNQEHIRAMAGAGFEFGSHTLTHPELPALEFEAKRREICESKSYLETELGVPIRFFCYPKGSYDEEALDLVRIAGYLGACCNTPGINQVKASKKNVILNAKREESDSLGFNPYLLKRTEVAHHDSLDDFKKKLAGAYDWMHQMLHTARGRA